MKIHARVEDSSDSVLVGPLSVRGQGRAPLAGLAHQGLNDAASGVLGDASTKRSHPSDKAKVVRGKHGDEATQANLLTGKGRLAADKAAAGPIGSADELSRSHISITEQQLKELGVVHVGLESTHNMFEDQVDADMTQMTKSDADLEASGTHTYDPGAHGELVPGRSTAKQLWQTEYRPIKS